MHMRLLLLGVENALGQALVRQGEEAGFHFAQPPEPVEGWTAERLSAVFEMHRPQVVINLAYYYDWFQAGKLDESVFPAQHQMIAGLTTLCLNYDCILLQPSSYRVFDGMRTSAYSEQDEVAPLDARGRALWNIEQLVRGQLEQHVLLRFGWILDESRDSLMGRFLQRLASGEEFFLADDRRGNPTPVDDAARVLLAVIKQLDCNAPLWGTYHYGGQEATTPLLVAEALYAGSLQFSQPAIAQLKAIAHSACDDASAEPQHGVLTTRKITNAFGIKPRAWRTGLEELLRRYYANDL